MPRKSISIRPRTNKIIHKSKIKVSKKTEQPQLFGDLWILIFKQSDLLDVIQWTRVSKEWRKLARSSKIWKGLTRDISFNVIQPNYFQLYVKDRQNEVEVEISNLVNILKEKTSNTIRIIIDLPNIKSYIKIRNLLQILLSWKEELKFLFSTKKKWRISFHNYAFDKVTDLTDFEDINLPSHFNMDRILDKIKGFFLVLHLQHILKSKITVHCSTSSSDYSRLVKFCENLMKIPQKLKKDIAKGAWELIVNLVDTVQLIRSPARIEIPWDFTPKQLPQIFAEQLI
jgi:hypothetical protein